MRREVHTQVRCAPVDQRLLYRRPGQEQQQKRRAKTQTGAVTRQRHAAEGRRWGIRCRPVMNPSSGSGGSRSTKQLSELSRNANPLRRRRAARAMAQRVRIQLPKRHRSAGGGQQPSVEAAEHHGSFGVVTDPGTLGHFRGQIGEALRQPSHTKLDDNQDLGVEHVEEQCRRPAYEPSPTAEERRSLRVNGQRLVQQFAERSGPQPLFGRAPHHGVVGHLGLEASGPPARARLRAAGATRAERLCGRRAKRVRPVRH